MKAKVIDFKPAHSFINEDNVLWCMAIDSSFEEKYIIEYRSDKGRRWFVDIRARTFEGVARQFALCHEVLGLDACDGKTGGVLQWERSLI